MKNESQIYNEIQQKLNEMAMSHGELLNTYLNQGKSITTHYLCLLILSPVLGNKDHWIKELNEFLSYISGLKWTKRGNQRIDFNDARISLFDNYLNYVDDFDDALSMVESKENVKIEFNKENEEYNKLKILNNFKEFSTAVLDLLYATIPGDPIDFTEIITNSADNCILNIGKADNIVVIE